MNDRFKTAQKANSVGRKEHGFGAPFAPEQGQRQVGWAKGIPSPFGRCAARRKLLKIERLRLFQFDAKLPVFGQALPWRKWETVWVI
jgi:hypothetical protein